MRRIVLTAIPQDEVAGQLGDQGSEHGPVRDACRGVRTSVHATSETDSQTVDQPDVPPGRVEQGAGAGLGVKYPDDEVAAHPCGVHQPTDLTHHVGVGDRLPLRSVARRFLDIDDDERRVHASIMTCR